MALREQNVSPGINGREHTEFLPAFANLEDSVGLQSLRVDSEPQDSLWATLPLFNPSWDQASGHLPEWEAGNEWQ